MPQRNMTGGKAFKKNKKGLGTNDKEGGGTRFTSKAEGQDYGRVTRLLGNRRVMCFCNDGLDRVCKIRGGICRGSHNKQKIDIGDIVLISYRDYVVPDSDSDEQNTEVEYDTTIDKNTKYMKSIAGKTDTVGTESAATLGSGKKDIADILMKYERTHWRDIRKEKHIHSMLFPMSANTGLYSADDIFEDVESSHQDDTIDVEPENIVVDDI